MPAAKPNSRPEATTWRFIQADSLLPCQSSHSHMKIAPTSTSAYGKCGARMNSWAPIAAPTNAATGMNQNRFSVPRKSGTDQIDTKTATSTGTTSTITASCSGITSASSGVAISGRPTPSTP